MQLKKNFSYKLTTTATKCTGKKRIKILKNSLAELNIIKLLFNMTYI